MASSNMIMESKRLLRPQTKIDMAMEIDRLTGLADIRASIILEVNKHDMAISQTSPPIRKSQIGQETEVSIVHQTSTQAGRWGWSAIIKGINNQYPIHLSEGTVHEQAIIISKPKEKHLTKRNIRQAYRLESHHRYGITLKVHPSPAPLTLLNFSAHGLMLGSNQTQGFEIGQGYHIELNFPRETPLPNHYIRGKAEIVRISKDIEPGKSPRITLGLKFQDLCPDTLRIMPKILHHYMLEEQRMRNRDKM